MTYRDLRQHIFWLIIKAIKLATHRPGDGCKNCAMLSEILKWTEKELQARTKELEKAKHQLRRIERLAEQAAKSGAEVMSDDGVPRGNWAYAKAQNEFGNRALAILERKTYHPKKSVVRLFKKLFR